MATSFEKGDALEHQAKSSSDGSRPAGDSGVEAERAALLAALPDPDAGKTPEERAEIVSLFFVYGYEYQSACAIQSGFLR